MSYLVRKDNPSVRIVGTKETIPGVAHFDTVTVDESGHFTIDYNGGTEVDWDSQVTVKDVSGGRLFVDENDDELWECDVVLVECVEEGEDAEA